MLARAWALLLLLAPPTAVPAPAARGGAPALSRGGAGARTGIAAARADRHARGPLPERAARRQDAVRSPAGADRGGRRLRRPRTARPAQGDRQRPAPGTRHRRPAVRGPRGLLLARRLDRVPGTPGRGRPDRSDHQRRLHRVLADRRRARRAAQAQRPAAARDRRGAGGGPALRRHRDRARARRAPPVFTDLGKLLDGGDHRVIIIAGNHDADLLWPKVQLAIARAIKPRDPVAPDLHARPHLRAPAASTSSTATPSTPRTASRPATRRSAATATAPAACSRAGARCSSTSSTRTSSARCRSSTTSTRSPPRSSGRCATTPIRSATPAR